LSSWQLTEQFAVALSHHKAGRLAEAERLYRQICAVDPDNVGSLHYLGVLAGQVGRNDLAIDLIGRAVALNPDYAEAHCNLGRALAMQRRPSDAMIHFQRAVALKPNYTEAQIGLGNLLKEQGKFSEAAASYERVLALRPDYAEAHHNLGTVHSAQGNLTAAMSCFERALVLRPDNPEAWLGRAQTLQRLSRPEEAIVAYRNALAKGGDPEVIIYHLASLGAEAAPPAAPKQVVAEGFDQHADRYDQHVLGALKYQTPDLLFDAMTRFTASRDLDILDLGCGTGLFGARLHPRARRLIGVDISSKMLIVAQQRQIYDNLVCSELIEFLQTQVEKFDLVGAADVFVYIGDLSGVFHGVRSALRDGGLFGFSVEISEEQEFALQGNLKYAHSDAYIRRLAKDHGFVVETIDPQVIRQNGGIDVVGFLAVLRRAQQ
jgi:predicted TPR repeat methyltransferase